MNAFRYLCHWCKHPANFSYPLDSSQNIKCAFCGRDFSATLLVNTDQKPPKHGSPEFYKLLEEMSDLHDRKSHDYASNSNPFGNYTFAGQMAVMFSHSPQDAGFVGRLAEKLYRIANIEREGKTTLNETIEDTEKDICVIVALWVAARRDRRKKLQESKVRVVGEIHTQGLLTPDERIREQLAKPVFPNNREIREGDKK